MQVFRLGAFALAASLTLGGCLGGGLKHYKTGEKAYASGDLDAADRAYAEALKAEPNNAEYQRAQKRVRAELAAQHRAEARAKEQSGDWSGASAAWSKAAELSPEETEYAVRRDLSALKSQSLGPDEWYEGVRQVQGRYPGQDIAEKSLAGARAAAYKFNLDLAEQYLATREGPRAFTHFERAKELDPSTPGLSRESYDKAEALSIAEQAAAKARAGDPVAAHELYTQAYAKAALPEIKNELNRVKAQASAILTKLEAARARADKGRFDEALKIYESLAGTAGVPASVEAEMSRAREELVKRAAEAATKLAERGDVEKAHRELAVVVRHAELAKVGAEMLQLGLDQAKDGAPGKALASLDQTGLAPGTPLFEASHALALASAKRIVGRAQALAKRDGKKALEMVGGLDAFEAQLPEIAAIRRDLRAGSFNELLDEALRVAKAGNDGEASALLLAALNASAAPENMRTPTLEAAERLKGGRYAEAEKSFSVALTAAPRSRLAQRGVDIARLRRQQAEQGAVDVLRRGGGDDGRAVDVLAAGLELEPGNAQAKRGAEALLERLRKADGLTAPAAAELVRLAARLVELPAKAATSVQSGAQRLAENDLKGAEGAFAAAQESAPSAELPRLGRELAQRRALAVLRSDATKAVATGGEGSAAALAELLERDPKNAEARAALAALLDKAAKEAKEKRDGEAARLLGLATIATSPAPGVKVALEQGNAAFAAGKMADAEKAYAEALDLEPEQQVAKAGYELARSARVGALSAAVEAAKGGGGVEQARAALERSLAIDPNGPEARKAFAELLEEARRQSKAGNDRQAAALLDVANVVSKPETARRAIGEANAKLGEGRHAEAEAAYDEVLSSGDSQVAKTGKELARERRVSVLVAGTSELESGGDEERGAKAAAELRALDPVHPKVAAAVSAALARAERVAAGGDDKAAARALRAAAAAIGEDAALARAIELYETGKLADAESAFATGSTSEIGRRGAALARARRLGSLKAGLSGEGDAKAQSIRALLAADPTNKEAQKAFRDLLDAAKRAGAKGQDADAATSLRHANIAAGSPEDLTASIEVGVTHLGEGRYAEAERAFSGAVELAPTSEVAKTGAAVARGSRQRQEQEASRALGRAGDPRPHARTLSASFVVEPSSKLATKALDDLLRRAQASAKRQSDADVAQELEAAALLENLGMELTKAVGDAAGLYAKASFGEAEAAFASASNGTKSRVAELGASLARARRVAILEAELEAARKEQDVLRQSGLVAQILELDANNAKAKALQKVVGGDLKTSRLDTARLQKEQGKLGIAWVYVGRALKLDPSDAKAKAELEELEAALKKRTDLVMVVEPVARGGSLAASACVGLDPLLREELMSLASNKKDLGGYVLSPTWTEAVENKDPKAPEVSGAVKVTIATCMSGSSIGKGSFEWSLQVPPGGEVVASGKKDAELPVGAIPVDEQDGAGNNARKAFAKRAAKELVEELEVNRSKTSLWLLSLAEHGMKKDDVALAADALARLAIVRPRSVEPARVEKVERWLDERLK